MTKQAVQQPVVQKVQHTHTIEDNEMFIRYLEMMGWGLPDDTWVVRLDLVWLGKSVLLTKHGKTKCYPVGSLVMFDPSCQDVEQWIPKFTGARTVVHLSDNPFQFQFLCL